MSMHELKLNMITEGNPHLLKALDRNTSHPLIRKASYINETLNISNDYDSSTNNTGFFDDENDFFNIILKVLLLPIPSVVILPNLISLIIWTTFQLFFN